MSKGAYDQVWREMLGGMLMRGGSADGHTVVAEITHYNTYGFLAMRGRGYIEYNESERAWYVTRKGKEFFERGGNET